MTLPLRDKDLFVFNTFRPAAIGRIERWNFFGIGPTLYLIFLRIGLPENRGMAGFNPATSFSGPML